MAFTNAPAAKQALLNVITARTALASVQVSYGHPGDRIDPHESVFVDEVVVQQDWETMGGSSRRRKEDFTIEVVVVVGREGQAQQVAEARAWVLVEEVEQAVRADLTLQGTVMFAGLTDATQTNFAGPQGWVSQVVCKVTCRAQVTG